MAKKIDKGVLMMDAGTALFESSESFGSTLGQLRAEMSVFGGKTFVEKDFGTMDIPSSYGDIFLDYSTPWRTRYISCRLESVEDDGKAPREGDVHRYAATFKEGNKSTGLRGFSYLFCVIMILFGCLVGEYGYIFILPMLVGAVGLVLSWLRPSTVAQQTVGYFIKKLSSK